MGHDSLTEAERADLRRLVDAGGVAGAARVLGVPRTAVLGALAGAPIRTGTVVVVRTRLAAVGNGQPPPRAA